MRPAVFLILLIFLVPLNLEAQTEKQSFLGGRILDALTQEPIPHVEVFVSETTSGCISDAHGYFKLKIPYLPCTIVARHVSYKSRIQAINSYKNLDIQLKPADNKIAEVGIVGKNKRKRNLRFFLDQFIPDSRRKIKVLNDSVLFFERDEMKFRAYTRQPLLIENEILGYRISLLLEEFEVVASDGPAGRPLPLNSIKGGYIKQLTGHYFYESLENEFPDQKEYYQYNRQEIYYGSYRHFLKSVYDGDTGNQGFQIDVFDAADTIAFHQLAQNESGNKQMVIRADSLKVHYYHMDDRTPVPLEYLESFNYIHTTTSTIYPTPFPFWIRPNGTSPKLSFVIDGLLVNKSFANSLPKDYIPTRKKLK